MHLTRKAAFAIAAASTLFLGLTGTAFADGYADGAAAAPADEGRKFTWSLTMGATSDYIFRGISLNDEDPAFQPSVNFSYGIVYFGLWGSNITGDGFSPWETDVYAGIKPVWHGITFDLGAVWYTYPGASRPGGLGLDYVELKAGASYSPFKNLTYTPVFWWTPDQGSHYSESFTTESTLAYALPACGIFTPTLSGLYGWSTAQNDDFFLGQTDDYSYWNVGLALAVEKFTFDFRYWDTDINNDLSDSRFVFSANVTLP